MPSARMICLSFIGQSRPQGKASWFSCPREKKHTLLRAEIPCSAPPTLSQTHGPPRHRIKGRWGLCSKPLLPHQGVFGANLSWALAFGSLKASHKCTENSAVSRSRGVETPCLEPLLPVTLRLPGNVPIPWVLGRQKGAAEGLRG